MKMEVNSLHWCNQQRVIGNEAKDEGSVYTKPLKS